MAIINLNGWTATMAVECNNFTVIAIEVSGTVATASAISPHGAVVSLTLINRVKGSVDISYSLSRGLDLEKGVFSQPHKGSITEQVRYALAGL